MSSSSDDDFFMASASEDEEELKHEFESVYTTSMSDKKEENPSPSSDTSEDNPPNKSAKPTEKSIDSDPEYTNKNITGRGISKRSMQEENINDEHQSKRTRASNQQLNDENIAEYDLSRPTSAKSSRSNSSSSSTRQFGRNNDYDVVSDDETDAFFKELSKKATPSNSNLKSDGDNSVKSSPKRIYNIRFLSKLEGTIDRSVRVKVLGKFTFAKIIPSALQGLKKAYKIPKVMKNIYDPANVMLYWNNAKLLDFMTCNSLNIKQEFENEISNVDILLVSSEKGKEMEVLSKEEWMKHTAEASQKLEEEQKNENADDTANTDLVIEEFEKELQDITATINVENTSDNNNDALDVSDENNDDIMKISLVGQDNKKLYVNVRTTTPLIKLVNYYRTQKKLPQKSVLNLSFDDEKLDLKHNVGDYDIEDEDMIEVVLIK